LKPAGTRLSIKGRVEEVSPKKETARWSRTDLLMRDKGIEVACKLWAEKADLPVSFGENIILTNMTVSVYRDIISLNSTDLTNVEKMESTRRLIRLEIAGYNEDRDILWLLTGTGDMYKCDTGLFTSSIGVPASIVWL